MCKAAVIRGGGEMAFSGAQPPYLSPVSSRARAVGAAHAELPGPELAASAALGNSSGSREK